MNLFARTLGAGRDVVLVHGWGLHSGVFDDVAAALSRTWRVTLIDLPGHGQSRGAPFSTDLSRLAKAIARAAPPHACWLGWSLGGLVAMQHALDRPQDPCALILMASSPRFVKDEAWPGVDPRTLEAFADGVKADYRKTLRRFLALQVQGCENHGELLHRLKQQLLRYPPPSPETLEAGLSVLRDTDLRRQLPRIARPAFLIYGEYDRIVPGAAVEAFSRVLPAGRSYCFKGAGHAPFLSHPGQFLKVMETVRDET